MYIPCHILKMLGCFSILFTFYLILNLEYTVTATYEESCYTLKSKTCFRSFSGCNASRYAKYLIWKPSFLTEMAKKISHFGIYFISQIQLSIPDSNLKCTFVLQHNHLLGERGLVSSIFQYAELIK